MATPVTAAFEENIEKQITRKNTIHIFRWLGLKVALPNRSQDLTSPSLKRMLAFQIEAANSFFGVADLR